MKAEIRYFCLACLGTEFYIATLDLIDGTQAWLHMCVECNIRMEYCGLLNQQFLPEVVVWPQLLVLDVVLTLQLPIRPVVVVWPQLFVLEVVLTRSLPIRPVVVVWPQLLVLEVVLTRLPLQVPEVVVWPQLLVLEVKLQLADAGTTLSGNRSKETTPTRKIHLRPTFIRKEYFKIPENPMF